MGVIRRMMCECAALGFGLLVGGTKDLRCRITGQVKVKGFFFLRL